MKLGLVWSAIIILIVGISAANSAAEATTFIIDPQYRNKT